MYDAIVTRIIVSNKIYAIAVYSSRLSALRYSNLVLNIKRLTRKFRFQLSVQ
jgi:hypothetical protein